MTQLRVIKHNIQNMQDAELAKRLLRRHFSDEAIPIAEAEFENRGYQLSVASFEKIINDHNETLSAKPYKPYLLPILFSIFGGMAGGKLGAAVYNAIGAGLGSIIFTIPSWYLASFIAKWARKYNKFLRFMLQTVSFIIWGIICSFIISLNMASVVGADQVSYPNMPKLEQFTNIEYGISIQFPEKWKIETPLRNEIWLAQGTVKNETGICFVRVTEVTDLQLSTPDEFFSQTDEVSFVKLTSMSMPDIKVHLFDIANLGGRKSRRIIYSGTDSGMKTGNVIYQVLDGDRIFTVGCLSELSVFNLVYNDFEAIISRFEFNVKNR
jgi:hypothetical protein